MAVLVSLNRFVSISMIKAARFDLLMAERTEALKELRIQITEGVIYEALVGDSSGVTIHLCNTEFSSDWLAKQVEDGKAVSLRSYERHRAIQRA